MLETTLKGYFRYRWRKKSIKYLGIQIPANLDDLYGLNYIPLLRTIKKDLERWSSGWHSWFRRTTAIKMNVLPPILYVLQTIPINAKLQAVFLKNVWARRSPRIRTLMRPKEQGGIGLPDIRRNFYATHCARILDWNRHGDYKQWVEVEWRWSKGELLSWIWGTTSPPVWAKKHPTIWATLQVARKLEDKQKFLRIPSPLLLAEMKTAGLYQSRKGTVTPRERFP